MSKEPTESNPINYSSRKNIRKRDIDLETVDAVTEQSMLKCTAF